MWPPKLGVPAVVGSTAAWSHGRAGSTVLELQVDHVVEIIFVSFYSYPLHSSGKFYDSPFISGISSQ